jgi:hypothetical protein
MFDLKNILNDLVEGTVLFSLQFLGNIFFLLRHPFRAPAILTARYLRKDSVSISPYVFLTINAILGFWAIQAIPRIFLTLLTDEGQNLWPSFIQGFHGIGDQPRMFVKAVMVLLVVEMMLWIGGYKSYPRTKARRKFMAMCSVSSIFLCPFILVLLFIIFHTPKQNDTAEFVLLLVSCAVSLSITTIPALLQLTSLGLVGHLGDNYRPIYFVIVLVLHGLAVASLSLLFIFVGLI